MSYIRFNDGSQRDLGSWARGITGSPPAAPVVTNQSRLGSQFLNWTPFDLDRADVAEAMATGALYAFDRANEIPGASFTIAGIRNDAANQDTITRFERHARRGGQFTIATEDRADRSYATCGLAAGSRVQVRVTPDGRFVDVSIVAVNLAGSPAKMIADFT